MRELSPHESELVGGRTTKHGKTIEDAVSKRIRWLVRNSLKRVAVDETGWDTLYEDLHDGRLWELIYPNSEKDSEGS